MEEFFTKVKTTIHERILNLLAKNVTSSFAQVGQVRTLLDKLSRHVEEVQKRHVVMLSNPIQEQSESRTGRKSQTRTSHSGALALAYVSFSPYLAASVIAGESFDWLVSPHTMVKEIVRIKLQECTKTSDVSKISCIRRGSSK